MALFSGHCVEQCCNSRCTHIHFWSFPGQFFLSKGHTPTTVLPLIATIIIIITVRRENREKKETEEKQSPKFVLIRVNTIMGLIWPFARQRWIHYTGRAKSTRVPFDGQDIRNDTPVLFVAMITVAYALLHSFSTLVLLFFSY